MARGSGVDIGTASAKWLSGELKGTTFVVHSFALGDNEEGTLAGGWAALAGQKLGAARIGVNGRDLNMRYTRVPRLPDWQLRRLMRFETEEIGGQSDSEVASDFNVLPEMPEIEGEDVVLLALARESLLAEHVDGLKATGGKVDAFTPNALGLYNAFLRYGTIEEETVLLADIGHENLNVVLVRGADLVFARNLSGGSRLFDKALAERFGIDEKRARAYKLSEGTLDTGRPFKDPNQEKAGRALAAPAGQILSLLQSAVVFAKSQVKISSLKLDRVLLCGGGARLAGLPAYLTRGMSVPVELFDPFRVVDLSKLDPESAERLEAHKLEAVTALGLATAAADPEAYGLEILPERVRKTREFQDELKRLEARVAEGPTAGLPCNLCGEMARALGTAAKTIADTLSEQGYGKDYELAADWAGSLFLCEVGYRASAIAEYLEMLPTRAGTRWTTHPSSEERIEALRPLVFKHGCPFETDDGAQARLPRWKALASATAPAAPAASSAAPGGSLPPPTPVTAPSLPR